MFTMGATSKDHSGSKEDALNPSLESGTIPNGSTMTMNIAL
jgi:hypothetical protein